MTSKTPFPHILIVKLCIIFILQRGFIDHISVIYIQYLAGDKLNSIKNISGIINIQAGGSQGQPWRTIFPNLIILILLHFCWQ